MRATCVAQVYIALCHLTAGIDGHGDVAVDPHAPLGKEQTHLFLVVSLPILLTGACMSAVSRAPVALATCHQQALNFEGPFMGPFSVPQSMAKLLTPTIGVNRLATKLAPLSVPMRGTTFYTTTWPTAHITHGSCALPFLPLPHTLLMSLEDLHISRAQQVGAQACEAQCHLSVERLRALASVAAGPCLHRTRGNSSPFLQQGGS